MLMKSISTSSDFICVMQASSIIAWGMGDTENAEMRRAVTGFGCDKALTRGAACCSGGVLEP